MIPASVMTRCTLRIMREDQPQFVSRDIKKFTLIQAKGGNENDYLKCPRMSKVGALQSRSYVPAIVDFVACPCNSGLCGISLLYWVL